MSTLTISMPDSLREFVEHRVSTSGYGNTSEYMRELVRRDREGIAKAQFEMELLKGLEGEGIPVNDAYWERKKLALLARFEEQQAARLAAKVGQK